jgi:hypothetical protein
MDMLALDDAALAPLVRGAREVPRRVRGRWLRDIAAKLDPSRCHDATRWNLLLLIRHVSIVLTTALILHR